MKNSGVKIAVGVVLALGLLNLISSLKTENTNSGTYRSGQSHSYSSRNGYGSGSSNTSQTPPRPAVNTTPAMTKEEADRLGTTGVGQTHRLKTQRLPLPRSNAKTVGIILIMAATVYAITAPGWNVMEAVCRQKLRKRRLPQGRLALQKRPQKLVILLTLPPIHTQTISTMTITMISGIMKMQKTIGKSIISRHRRCLPK